MAISKQFVEYVLEQLQGLERLTSRRMFSGVGLYSDGLFFGLLYHERLYFKTDDTTRPAYEARGSEGFRPPHPHVQRMKMKYYTVPADVLEDAEELVKWARQAKAVALASESAKAAKSSAKEGGKRKKGRGKSRPAEDGQRTVTPRKVAGDEGQPTVGPRKIVRNEGQRTAARGKVAGEKVQRTARSRKVASANVASATNKRAKSR